MFIPHPALAVGSTNCSNMSAIPDTRDISELPEDVQELLYNNRLLGDLNVPKDEYISRYKTVMADGIVYFDMTEKGRVETYLSHPSEFYKTSLLDAIVGGGIIAKNRFGCKNSYAIL